MFTLAILQWLIYGVERETPFTYEWEDPTLYSVPLSGSVIQLAILVNYHRTASRSSSRLERRSNDWYLVTSRSLRRLL